jgi:hypothetical protein
MSHPLLFNHIILAHYDFVWTQLGSNIEFQYNNLGYDTSNRVQVSFHAAGYGKVLPNWYLEMSVTFECMHYSSIT